MYQQEQKKSKEDMNKKLSQWTNTQHNSMQNQIFQQAAASNQMYTSSMQQTRDPRDDIQYRMLERILVELSELKDDVAELRRKVIT